MEIGSVRFSASNGRLEFTFMLKGEHSAQSVTSFKQLALNHLEVYAAITGHAIGYFGVSGVVHGDYTQVEIARDVATVSREELSLLIGLIRSQFGQDLVVEHDEPLRDDERVMQEELIDDALEDVSAGGPHRELVGFCDAGRVMVFNKNPGAGRQQGSGNSQRQA
jgi:hypothetical protein